MTEHVARQMRTMYVKFGEKESGDECRDCRWFADLIRKRSKRTVHRCIAHDALFPENAIKNEDELWFNQWPACGLYAERRRTMSTSKRYIVNRPKHKDVVRIIKSGDTVKFTRIDDRWKGESVAEPFSDQYDFSSRTYRPSTKTQAILCHVLAKYIYIEEAVAYPTPDGWIMVPGFGTPDDYKDIP